MKYIGKYLSVEILLTLEFLRFRDIRLLLSYLFTGSGVILESDGDIIRCCGLIMEWEIYAKKTGTLKIIVWRPTNKAGEESKRTIVGINTFTVSSKLLKYICNYLVAGR
jgi:hypothetical protein